jgi:hypothetical protein
MIFFPSLTERLDSRSDSSIQTYFCISNHFSMEQYLFTAMFAVAGMIGILSLILWLEKMIRIIMANYFIASILLAFNNFFDLISSQLLVGKIDRRVDGLQHWIWTLLLAGKPTLLLTIYFVLLIFLMTKSRISFWNIQSNALRVWLTILFLPCTVLSILLGISIAIFGGQMVSLEWLRILAYSVSNIPYAYNIVLLTPVRIILPGIITILVAVLVLRNSDQWSSNDIVIELDNK